MRRLGPAAAILLVLLSGATAAPVARSATFISEVVNVWDAPLGARDTAGRLDVRDATAYALVNQNVTPSDVQLYFFVRVFGAVGGPGYPDDRRVPADLRGLCPGGIDTDFAVPGPEYSVCVSEHTGTFGTASFSYAHVKPLRPGLSAGGYGFAYCCARHRSGARTLSDFQFVIPADRLGNPPALRFRVTSTAGAAADRVPDGPGTVFLDIARRQFLATFPGEPRPPEAITSPPPEVISNPAPDQPPADRSGPVVRIGTAARVSSAGETTIAITCPGAEPAGCEATLLLARSLRPMTSRVHVPSGRRRRVPVRLTGSALSRLRNARTQPLPLTVLSYDQLGNRGRTRRTLTLTPALAGP